ncbi:transmembrane protein [Colletotrichum musicola]|uniref:Transmembrane protein n=3 Tax=Colletotrichum orchidearum species complex TaxID=2707337 RepID=A0A8H6IZK0_9PEZI|nr:transmembrane protein [Colletotrichum sojae]KAF6803381.1 transmembrane protein [Colletotrichum musicola]KAF6821154.1 transmembrane protein [Colletotrichum plurivorum]
MAHHPSFTLAGLLAVGGTAGFLKTQSKPSLIAGLGLGAAYAYSGYLLKENKDYGAELALGNSIVLLGAGASRAIKTGGKAPVPLALTTVGLLATFYYQKKYREFTYGV